MRCCAATLTILSEAMKSGGHTTIVRNEIRETRQPMKRIGVRIGAQVGQVTLENNRIEGLAVKISDLRKNP